MFNLLNGIAAAAGSFYSRRPISEPETEPKRSFFEWLYRNLCWYGMQIQRRTNTIIRKFRKLLRPIGQFMVDKYHTSIVHPIEVTRTTFSEIGEEMDEAKIRIDKARQEGVSAAAKTRVRAVAGSMVKHRTYLVSAVNIILPLICLAVLAVTISTIANRTYALEVTCGGETMGYISDESDYTAASLNISKQLLCTNENIENSLKPSYRLTVAAPSEISSAEELSDNMLYSNNEIEEGYGLYIDGELIAVLKSEGDLSFILDNYRESFGTGNTKGSLSFVQDIETKFGLYSTDNIVTSAQLKEMIEGDMPKKTSYTVKSKDTVEKLCSKYAMTEERFYELNPDIQSKGLKKGEKITIEKLASALEVKNVIVRSYTVKTDFKSITVNDANQYVGYKKLKTEGKKGTNKLTEEIVYVDGKQVSRKITKTEVIKEPVDQVTVVGTKKKPVVKPSSSGKNGKGSSSSSFVNSGSRSSKGRFTWPVPGVKHVSSPFGRRWGKLHKGIDIATSGIYGRTVVAADSGKVTKASWYSSYGNCVMIQHSDGYVTLYAHLSKILVSNGQYVSKGQSVGKVGSTGNSTGPHLHFEVRKNGSYTNPLNYYN